jgi:high-affinity iron transporter
VIGNYLIGLREGVEAALIVSILLGYLSSTGRTELQHHVWRGVGVAVLFSIGIASTLQVISSELSDRVEPVFTGAMSLVAVAFVTWMVFWMKRTARTIGADLRGRLDAAALGGSMVAVSGMAFAAVAREGSETAVFFWAAARAAGQQGAALVGLLLGLSTAVAFGWAVYRSTRRVNMHKLFKVTGIMLVFVAAGVMSYAVSEWQEVNLLPGAGNVVLDLSRWLPEGSVAGVLASGLFNLHARTTGLQAAAYLTYLLAVLPLLLRPRKGAQPQEAKQSTSVSA